MLKLNDRVQVKGTDMRGTVIQVVNDKVVSVKYDNGVLAYTMCCELELLPVDKKTIRIKYFDDAKKLEKISKGDWIDLYANKDMFIPEGSRAMIPLGVAMELPEGYEAHLAPRSSTFKTWGIIQTNHVGVIDHSFMGDNDQWHMPVYCLKGMDMGYDEDDSVTTDDSMLIYGTYIHKGDKIAQFRIMEVQPTIEFEEVEVLGMRIEECVELLEQGRGCFVPLECMDVKNDLYLINEYGDIYSTVRHRILSKCVDKDGYYYTTLQNNKSKRYCYRLATLVIMIFKSDPPKDMLDPTVDHIDSNRINNYFKNLRWLDRGTNSSIRKHVNPNRDSKGRFCTGTK